MLIYELKCWQFSISMKQLGFIHQTLNPMKFQMILHRWYFLQNKRLETCLRPHIPPQNKIKYFVAGHFPPIRHQTRPRSNNPLDLQNPPSRSPLRLSRPSVSLLTPSPLRRRDSCGRRPPTTTTGHDWRPRWRRDARGAHDGDAAPSIPPDGVA